MITADGYSKDTSIKPDGIVLTMPVAFFEDRGMTADQFKDVFERHMALDGAYWNFKLKNLPTHEVLYVYILFDKKIQYRANLICYERNVSKSFKDSHDQKVRDFPHCNWILFGGPIVKPPADIPMKGFQGFRYSTIIF